MPVRGPAPRPLFIAPCLLRRSAPGCRRLSQAARGMVQAVPHARPRCPACVIESGPTWVLMTRRSYEPSVATLDDGRRRIARSAGWSTGIRSGDSTAGTHPSRAGPRLRELRDGWPPDNPGAGSAFLADRGRQLPDVERIDGGPHFSGHESGRSPWRHGSRSRNPRNQDSRDGLIARPPSSASLLQPANSPWTCGSRAIHDMPGADRDRPRGPAVRQIRRSIPASWEEPGSCGSPDTCGRTRESG